MSKVSSTEQILIELLQDNKNVTKKLIEQVEIEINILERKREIRQKGKETLGLLTDIIQNLKLKDYDKAKFLSQKAKEGFEGHLKEYLKKHEIEKQGRQPNRSAREPVIARDDHVSTTCTSRTSSSTHKSAHTSWTASKPETAIISENANGHEGGAVKERGADALARTDKAEEVVKRHTQKKQEKSGRDPDRPRVLAQKFKKIFDEEWVEAYEALLYEMKFEETKTHGILLTMVQDAYSFCKTEAKQQIQLMVSACKEIVHGGKQGDNQASADPGLSLIKEFREENAEIAIPRLEREFLKETTSKYFNETKLKEGHESITKFCNRCIRVTWWMNVHDPPVFMCPATLQEYVPERYEGLTATGSQPEYFVWPAIMSHEKGELLTKGRVVYLKK